jgi:hypothetical protein
VSAAAEQYAYLQMDPAAGAASLSPFLPLDLFLGNQGVSVMGLLDSGAAVNVLPYDVGVRLGAVWANQTTPVQLTGNLAAAEARVLVVTAVVGKFDPVKLAFAWSQANSVPVILGQINFFLEFDICFFRSRSFFEIKPKSAGPTS